MKTKQVFIAALLIGNMLGCRDERATAREVVRPEKIRSWREVYYDQDTYQKLAKLWKEYYDAYPSEDAYANWMYASRYAQAEKYEKLLDKGLKKYPANPTLLYLEGMKTPNDVNWAEPRRYLERAADLDPSYNDPWFSLAINYMQEGNHERSTEALRRLLENNAVADEVMDYSYNTLLTLDKDAILITHGDNDTYPAWILTRVVKFRPDVIIVNRSLMNTDWYPLRVMDEGAPAFTTHDEINSIHEKTAPPWSDTLIVRLVESAQRAGRSVYFSLTGPSSGTLARLKENGRLAGLSLQVTGLTKSYDASLRSTTESWLKNFRTGGMDSWRLRNAKSGDAGKMLVTNYGSVLFVEMDSLQARAPEMLPPLFDWYRNHLEPVLAEEFVTGFGKKWCEVLSTPEAQEWCRKKGF
jgi:hypothetical protein